MGQTKIIKECEAGVYVANVKGDPVLLTWQDLAIDECIWRLKSKFDKEWPAKWEEIKASIPDSPFPFIPAEPLLPDKLIEDAADIFLLTKVKLLMAGIGDKTADNLKSSIGKSKDQPLHKVIYALGIRHIGRENSKLLADTFGSLDTLGRAPWLEIIALPGVSAAIGTSVLEFFHLEASWRNIEKLRLGGVDYAFGYTKPEPEEGRMTTSFENFEKQWKQAENLNSSLLPQLYKRAEELGVCVVQIHDSLEFGGPVDQVNELLAWMKTQTNLVKGKIFMFTGRLETMTRHIAQEKVESLGGIAGSCVTKRTTYLVVGEKPGSKLFQARMLDVKTITEEEFLELLAQTL